MCFILLYFYPKNHQKKRNFVFKVTVQLEGGTFDGRMTDAFVNVE